MRNSLLVSWIVSQELLSGLSPEDKREITSFLGSVNTKQRGTLQVQLAGRRKHHYVLEYAIVRAPSAQPFRRITDRTLRLLLRQKGPWLIR